MNDRGKVNNKKISPNLFYITAFIEDTWLPWFVFQKEIKQYEHKPTNSQQKKNSTILLLITKTFIAKAKNCNKNKNWLQWVSPII